MGILSGKSLKFDFQWFLSPVVLGSFVIAPVVEPAVLSTVQAILTYYFIPSALKSKCYTAYANKLIESKFRCWQNEKNIYYGGQKALL